VARRSAFLAIPVIAALVSGLYLVCVEIAVAFGLPGDLLLPVWVRLLGLPMVAYGLGMAAWVLRFRGPTAILESTWATLRKLARREPIAATAGRTEPLVVSGPYRLVRHPLYSGVDGLAFGAALLADHPWAYLGALLLALWFALVLAPFEERELRALFGPAYDDYRKGTRRFLPIRGHR
jgi:protein-S-isoprenylcysteine O-methyltransferase Ste14